MEIKKSLLGLSLVTALCPVLAQAAQPSYSYIDAGYLQVELDELSLDPTGFFVRGSADVAENWFLRGGFASADDSTGFLDVETDQFNVGGGFKTGIGENTSLNFTVDYLNADAEVETRFGFRDSADVDGYGLGAQIRTMVSSNFELNAGLGYADMDTTDGFEFNVGAAWYATEQFAIVAEVGADEDSNNQYLIGGRLSF